MKLGLQVEAYIPSAPPPPPPMRWGYQIMWYLSVPPPPPKHRVLRAIRKPSIRRRARHARSHR